MDDEAGNRLFGKPCSTISRAPRCNRNSFVGNSIDFIVFSDDWNPWILAKSPKTPMPVEVDDVSEAPVYGAAPPEVSQRALEVMSLCGGYIGVKRLLIPRT